MFGEDEEHASKENALIISHEACRSDLVGEMIECLPMLEFESRKDVASIFSAILRIEGGDGSMPGLAYMKNHLELIYSLFEGYERPEIALCCGQMFRECIRHEELAKLIINDNDLFRDLFSKMDLDNFEIASDAFLTLKDILTRHKAVVSVYLTEHYSEFLENYQTLLESSNYVTRRQSVKLLGELLLDRSNVKAMMIYVSDVSNLKIMMNLLKDSSKSIQFEAFHVFKVFVANPNKTYPVIEVLLNNKEKLLGYLEKFQSDRGEGERETDRR
jgi:calcium binding protein 39